MTTNMNDIIFRQLTPHGWNENGSWPVDIDKLRYTNFFKAARHVASSREAVHCHCSANERYISLDSANSAIPYNMNLAEGWGVDRNDFRLRVSHRPGCFKSTIDLCYTVSGGRLESMGTLWWPKENGWWLHIDDHDHRDADAIRSTTVVKTFLRDVFPGSNYRIGDRRLITLTHEDAVGVIERTVDWFLNLCHTVPRNLCSSVS